MDVIRYTSASDFLTHTRSLLERRESFNTLMLGICLALIDQPEQYPNFYLWTVEHDGQAQAAALLTPPHDLLLYADPVDQTAAALLAQSLHDDHITLPGVGGAVEAVHAFADAWTNQTGQKGFVRRHSRVYELRQVRFPSGVLGRCIQAEAEHRAVVSRWIWDFYHGNVAMDKAEATADHHIADHTLYLWEVEETPVSMAVGPTRPTQHGGIINFVYTPPEQRQHGYASAVVAALSQQILDSGKLYCSLFTNLANPTSNSIYQKIGYIPCGDFDELKFDA